MGTQFFVDETKAKSYVVVAAACPDGSIRAARRAMGRLILPGQRSIHMKNESPRRRRQIADAVAHLSGVGLSAFVLDAGRGPEPEHVRRDRALHAIVERASLHHSPHVVLDLDHTLLARDRRTIAAAAREVVASDLSYAHLPLASEPLLTIPDVIAWCWARGEDWRRRVMPVVSDVTHV